ncbi:class I SAM-dependent methyltransferase [Halioglobus maricola]|uniref:Class I SAM-dependent methyltransferase n=1 Tax=Halioglobus maricola TaxID=2601894 RepID=A0A5P9NK15_9GAMM|nr:class I SAM-dependent methyltransferase [Halioglobus maricola]QFU75826.1 class I SAM-dependent methyltransferase [Halioglobus maricola]
MDELALLEDLFLGTPRQGPGSPDTVRRALELCALDAASELQVADIGCGTGASTLQLAQILNASITAVDFLPRFLARLDATALDAGLASKIHTLCCSMGALPFAANSMDMLWSEGAIYNMGFASGVKAWHPFLKPGGLLVVSEITWSHSAPADELRAFWQRAYPEVDTAGNKIRVLEANGYSPIGYFLLPEECWTEHYYAPLAAEFEPFLKRHEDSEAASAIVAENRAEIALHEKYSGDFSYGMYIARKC